MAWGGWGSDRWRGRASSYSRPRARTPTSPPQSEQRWTATGYNSPIHNAYVGGFTGPIGPGGSMIPVTQEGYQGFLSQLSELNSAPTLGSSTAYTGGGGGGRRYGGGGGGGGGGGPAMTQALLDQMLGVLGARAPALALQQTALPAFRGRPLGPFNAAPYQQAARQLTAAGVADRAAANRVAQQTSQALQNQYSNAYANANVTRAPAAQQVGAGLQETAGGGGDQAAVAQESNAAAAGDQASFQNLLNVLAAADQSAQASRMGQVQMDRQAALGNIAASQRGLLGGINMARAQAANQWSQMQQERAYQNSLMAQQWAREAMMRRQDIANQQRQANWQQSNEFISSRMTPLLELLAGLPAAGAAGLNLGGLQQLLAGWGAQR